MRQQGRRFADDAFDMQVEEDEKENLRKAEERVKTCAAEAAFAAEMGLQMAQQQAGAVSEGEPLPEPGAEEGTHVAALQERQREAEEKVARLSKMIAGPLIPEVCRTPRHHAPTPAPLHAVSDQCD